MLGVRDSLSQPQRDALMIRSTKDLWIGLIYIFFGSSAILIAR